MTDRRTSAIGSSQSRIDTTVPNSARAWDYLLGGKDNYAVDREAAERLLAAMPQLRELARSDRAFLSRAVRYLAAEAGVRQFLDLGTGLPTAENTHEVAQAADPTCRIVYVDNDPIVLAHARALLASAPGGATGYVDADIRDVDVILREAAETLDLSRPVALMMLGVLEYIPDSDDPYAMVDRYMAALPPGSHLVIAHGAARLSAASIHADDQVARLAETTRIWRERGGVPLNLREPEAVERFFDGLDVVEPGIGFCSLWRPIKPADEAAVEASKVGGVGRKR